jgi:uncharacterized protein (DUF433 family)
MDWREYIEQRSDIMMGKPVFQGTRLTVELILERLADGATEGDLFRSYPRLKPEHIRAAYAFAAENLSVSRTVLADEGAS